MHDFDLAERPSASAALVEPGFLSQATRERWFVDDVTLMQCDFDLTQFDDALFSDYRIDCPDSIRRSVPKRRAEYLAGRYCARRALHLLGVPNAQIPTGAARAPQWPTSLVGSISHSRGCALAAVGSAQRYRGIGIDVEHCVAASTLDTLLDAVLNERERALLPQSPDQRARMFTLMFSLKESFFKAAYPTVGEYFDFDAVTVLQIDHVTATVQFETNYRLADPLPALTRLQGQFRPLSDDRVVTFVALAR